METSSHIGGKGRDLDELANRMRLLHAQRVAGTAIDRPQTVDSVILKIIEGEDANTQAREFKVGELYEKSNLADYLAPANQLGNTYIFNPKVNGNGIGRLYFTKERQGIFKESKFRLFSIEEKTEDEKHGTTIATVCGDDGSTCFNFKHAVVYDAKIIGEYLRPISSPKGKRKKPEDKWNNISFFESRAHDGNGHVYMFREITTLGGYLLIGVQKKEDVFGVDGYRKPANYSEQPRAAAN